MVASGSQAVPVLCCYTSHLALHQSSRVSSPTDLNQRSKPLCSSEVNIQCYDGHENHNKGIVFLLRAVSGNSTIDTSEIFHDKFARSDCVISCKKSLHAT